MQAINFAAGHIWRRSRLIRRRRSSCAYTLTEMMVATAILLAIMTMVLGMVQMTSKVWSQSNARLQSFQSARHAFETMTRSLGQATLNTYWGYDNPTTPTQYLRKSELHFISGTAAGLNLPSALNARTHAFFFQTPLGVDNSAGGSTRLRSLLNACGYYVAFGSDAAFRPSFLLSPNKYRYRLYQFLQPTDKLDVFKPGIANDWFLKPLALAKPPVQPLADNVVALIVLPRRSTDGTGAGTVLCPTYSYDTRSAPSTDPRSNQLPPQVDIILVAVDEPTAERWSKRYGTTAPPLGLETLFTQASSDSTTFQKLDQDLQTLETTLQAQGANYRVFRTSVLIQESKWSES